MLVVGVSRVSLYAERGTRLFLLDFSGFYRCRRAPCAHISLCGVVLCAASLFMLVVEELV